MKTFTSATIFTALAFAILGCSERSEKSAESTDGAEENDRKSSEVRLSAEHPSSSDVRRSRKISIGANNRQFLQDLRSHSDPVAFLESRWGELWKPSFEEQLPSMDTEALEELVNNLASENGVSFNEILSHGAERWAVDSDSKSSAISMATAFAAIFSSSDSSVPVAEVPKLFTKYQNQLPPTVGDVMICRMIMETSAFFDGGLRVSDDQVAAWNKLARAESPLYRLISLKIFSKFQTSSAQASTFYSAYSGEPHAGVRRVLVAALSNREESWAAEMVLKAKAGIPAN